MMITAALLCASLILPPTATDSPKTRDPSVAYQFRKAYGLLKVGEGQIDHCVALMCGGEDSANNLQFLCGPELPLKEKLERLCTVHFRCKSREENLATMQTCPGTVLRDPTR